MTLVLERADDFQFEPILGQITQYQITLYNSTLRNNTILTIRKIATGCGPYFVIYIDFDGNVFKLKQTYLSRDASDVMKQIVDHMKSFVSFARPCEISNFIHDEFSIVML